MASAIKAGFTLWYALVGGIGAWMIHHLVGLAAMVRLTCNDPSWDWALHGLTVVTLAMTGAALWLAWKLERRAGPAPGHHDDSSRRPVRTSRIVSWAASASRSTLSASR